MKLLLIVDRVDYPYAVNPRLAARLADTLAQQGHTIRLLELWDGEAAPLVLSDAVGLTRLRFDAERRMNEILEHGNAAGTPKAARLARLAQDPGAVRAAFKLLVLRRPARQVCCRKELEKLDRENFDAMIAVAAPFFGALALAEANVKAKKVLWAMDPYSIIGDPRAAAHCRLLYSHMDRLFVTREMLGEFSGTPYAEKTVVLDFPALVSLPEPASRAHTRRCIAFVGNLYPTLRTPHFALELFSRLNDPALEICFAGGGWEHYPPDFPEPYRQILGDRLRILGRLDPDQARQLLADADYLLNLGNAEADQLPSKIFEYFAGGKPILNLCRNPQDPALPYFERYPLALTLQQTDGANEKALHALANWLQKTAGQRLSFAQTEQLYRANTPAAVADKLTQNLENL